MNFECYNPWLVLFCFLFQLPMLLLPCSSWRRRWKLWQSPVMTLYLPGNGRGVQRQRAIQRQRTVQRQRGANRSTRTNVHLVPAIMLMERRIGGWGVMVVPAGSTRIVFPFPLYTMETGTAVSTNPICILKHNPCGIKGLNKHLID